MAATVQQSSETEKFSKSVTGSIKSLLNTGGRTYFILEHKTKSEKHRIGETREFIGDYVELGRGDSYAVNFGNDCSTVSRPHAAIARQGSGWVVKPLSQTNPTLVNRQRITKDWYLNNGDEIQLSNNGPVVAFLTPVNNKVGSMGMSVRMRAVVNEAIKPYKAIVATFVIVLLALVGGGVYIFKGQKSKIDELEKNLAALQKNITGKLDSTTKKREKLPPPPVHQEQVHPNIQALYPSVYFIASSKVTYTIGSQTMEKEYGLVATGFLLNDGTFVTAHHVVEPWLFEHESIDSLLNVIASNGGKVVLSFKAFSPDGSSIDFTSDQFTVNKSAVDMKTIDIEDKQMQFTVPRLGGTDYAFTKLDKRGTLVANASASSNLGASTDLYILGYPFAEGANGANDIKPVYSVCTVSRDGLDNGTIDISGRGFDQGNSGGPVFIKNAQGGYEVVGIVSAEHGNQGYICPISSIR